MAEELERDLFDEMLKKSSSNIVANPKKEWTPEESETPSEHQNNTNQPQNKEDEQA